MGKPAATKTAAPRRRAANLSIREDVLSAVKRHGINASQVAERALTEAVAEREHAKWLEENTQAIDEYNARVERHGVSTKGLRRF